VNTVGIKLRLKSLKEVSTVRINKLRKRASIKKHKQDKGAILGNVTILEKKVENIERGLEIIKNKEKLEQIEQEIELEKKEYKNRIASLRRRLKIAKEKERIEGQEIAWIKFCKKINVNPN